MRTGALTPEQLLRAYASGIFPMAESKDDQEIFWVDPTDRAIFPLNGFHLSRSLKRRLRSGVFNPTLNQAFAAVLEGCANRPETWINDPIREIYGELHEIGHAHSIEIWKDGDLVGGVYGVTLGAAFFGESMFSTATDASKAALAFLIDRLRIGGFRLFDVQFMTSHLSRLGAIELTRDNYRRRLAMALRTEGSLEPGTPFPEPQALIQRITQTS